MRTGRELGFLGPGSVEAHVRHAIGFVRCAETFLEPRRGEAPAASAPTSFLDLGTGGGIPGLVLAEHWQESRAVLLDSQHRRTGFLEETVRRLGWGGRVQVVCARAEVAGRRADLRESFDLVVARSFGSPPVTAECASPFLRVGGLLVVSEPPLEGREASCEEQDGFRGRGGPPGDRPAEGVAGGEAWEAPGGPRWPAEGLSRVGLEPLAAWRDEAGYQVLRQRTPCPERFPRREGVPAKRPLYRL